MSNYSNTDTAEYCPLRIPPILWTQYNEFNKLRGQSTFKIPLISWTSCPALAVQKMSSFFFLRNSKIFPNTAVRETNSSEKNCRQILSPDSKTTMPRKNMNLPYSILKHTLKNNGLEHAYYLNVSKRPAIPGQNKYFEFRILTRSQHYFVLI